MKNTLLITTLLAASSVGAMAATAQLNLYAGGDINKLNSNGYNTGWTYTGVQESNFGATIDGRWTGNIGQDGVHNASSAGHILTHHRQNTSIDLGIDARYEFGFNFKLDQSKGGNGDLSMAGMYLAGSGGSIYFGNAQLGRYDDRRDAVLVKYNADIAEYNDNYGQDVFFPNGEFEYKLSSPYDYNSPVNGQWYTVVGGNDNTFDSGTYRLEIVIESFADESRADILYLYASTPDGERYIWPTDNFAGIGFAHNAYFDAYGFLLHNDGGAVATAEKMSGYEYSRVKREVITPEVPPVVPDIPEPSAFGLLAGAGALALVAARRRRSRS